MRLDDGRVVPAFFSQALKGKALTVFGDGSQTRSFCYVSDLVEGIYRLLLSDEHEPVNIGNPHEMTIMEFAKKIQKFTKINLDIITKPLPQDDPKVRQPDITKARKILGWSPQVDFEEGMLETMKYFKNELKL
jgi:dTDP-glucose 4,6-dehydratase